jgi:hypothetical protein
VIAITGQQPIARTSAWTDGQALTATALNAEHARHVIVHQQLARDIGRGLRLSLTEPATELRLPAQSARANRLLGFDAAGKPVPAVPNTGNLVVTPFAETLLDDTDAAAARATLGIEAAGDARYGRLDAANVWTQPQRVAAELRVDRADTGSEGGRLVSRRASDNADGYYWQTHGSGSTPVFRLVRAFGTPTVMLNISDSGAVTFTGALTLPGAPTASLHAATKGYVDGAIAGLPPPSVSVVAEANITSAVGQVDLALPSGPAMFILVVGDLRPSADALLRLRTSNDGITFQSGASDYSYAAGNTGGTASFMQLLSVEANDNAPAAAQFTIYPGAPTTPRFSIVGTVGALGGNAISTAYMGARNAAGRQQAIRLFMQSGNINRATIRLIGVA